MPIVIKPTSYLDAFQKGDSVSIQYRRFHLDDLIKVYDLVGELLATKKMDNFIPFAKTALKELIQNAVKATQKRVYFRVNGWNIQTDYNHGMNGFSDFLQENRNMPLPEGIQFTAEIFFEDKKDSVLVRVRNYGEVTEQERRSLDLMFARGKKMNSVQELLENEVKQKEGGGLGISMILVLGKSLKIPEPLRFQTSGGFTEFYLKLPTTE